MFETFLKLSHKIFEKYIEKFLEVLKKSHENTIWIFFLNYKNPWGIRWKDLKKISKDWWYV